MEPMLPKGYEPTEVEDKWYRRWEADGCFHADENSPRPHYSIVIPPPNVTGVLHRSDSGRCADAGQKWI